MKALITGASSGIGKDMAQNLAKKGYDLVLVARNEERLKELATEIEKATKVKVEIIPMDISVEENCKDLHKRVSNVDIFINNARIWGLWKFCKD